MNKPLYIGPKIYGDKECHRAFSFWRESHPNRFPWGRICYLHGPRLRVSFRFRPVVIASFGLTRPKHGIELEIGAGFHLTVEIFFRA